jgi:hypothetical protein
MLEIETEAFGMHAILKPAEDIARAWLGCNVICNFQVVYWETNLWRKFGETWHHIVNFVNVLASPALSGYSPIASSTKKYFAYLSFDNLKFVQVHAAPADAEIAHDGTVKPPT